ncbi:MAG: hypothetical protein LQ338_008135 [Usnochroma carphineum]|nr:MAG: hypothetical protein LQ338_008135 [Usnochroma carphineum]
MAEQPDLSISTSLLHLEQQRLLAGISAIAKLRQDFAATAESSSTPPKQKQKRIDVVEETHPIEAAWETTINPQVHKILEQSPKLDEAWASIGVRETDESSMAVSVWILGEWDPQFADWIEAKRQIRRVLDEEGFTDVGI